jgi:hypothetical protein
MGYISRRYYEKREDNSHVIWEYLSCVEKIAYHQLQDSPLNMEEVFCDDINICLLETESDLTLKRNCIKDPNRYYDIRREKNLEKPMEYIKKMIDNGILVGINTYFYDIPNFTWYRKERYKESIHVSMVVGYDERGFWLTDVPNLMKSDYLVDSHFTIIAYDDMRQYLAKQCNLLTCRVNFDSFSISDDLDSLLKKMIAEYSRPSFLVNREMIWIGREAYERLLYLIKKNDPRLLEMDFFHGEFVSFIISGRHDILKRNITKKYGNNSVTQDVLQWLEICQNKWKNLAYNILKQNIKTGIYTPKEEDISNIYEAEETLIEYFKLFVDRVGSK